MSLQQSYKLKYIFFNRLMLDEQDTSFYPPASLETATIANEKNYYTRLDDGVVNKSTVSGYPSNDSYTSPNDYIQQLRGDGVKVGAGILLKVMAGDTISVHASSWYDDGGSTPGTPVTPLGNIVSSILGSLPGVSGGKFADGSVANSMINPSINSFLNQRNATENTSHPRSWLNIIVLDEQLKPVITNDGNNSYFEQVGSSGGSSVQQYNPQRPITKNGYVYIYVSNETPNIYTYWDNLQVTHIHGHLLQEEGYYPFGLEMKAISSQAAMKMQTQYKFNSGTELETSFDADYYETYFRQYDAQIGRFTGVDALAEKTFSETPYHFGSDNPISFNDPSGAMRQFNVNGMAPQREAPTIWNPNFGSHESGWFENDFFDLITGGTTGGSMFSWNDFFAVLNSKHGGGWSEVTGVYFFKADPYNFTSSVTSAEQLQFGKYFAAISSTDAGQLLISKIAETGQVFTVTNGKLPDNSNALMEYSAKNNLMYVGSTMQGSSIEPGVFDALAHELFHAYQDYRGYHIPGRDDDEPDAYIFASLVDRQYSQTNLDNHDWMTQDIWNKLVVNPPSTRAEEDFLRAWDKFFDHGFSKEDYFQIFNNFLSGSTEGKRYRGPFNITNTHNLIYEFLNP